MSYERSLLGAQEIEKSTKPPELATSGSPTSQDTGRRLACPFFIRYGVDGVVNATSCTGNGWLNAHRVKEHLYRQHKPPTSCPRCHVEFPNSEDVHTHLNSETICDSRPDLVTNQINVMTEKQRKELGRKSKSKGELREEDRWYRIYKILFPDQLIIPSPYVPRYHADPTVGAEFQQHIRAELSAELRILLADKVPKDSKYVGLRSHIEAFIESAFDSGLVDEAVTRVADSFKKRRTLINADVPNDSHHSCIIIPASSPTETFALHSIPMGSLPSAPWSPRLSSSFAVETADPSGLVSSSSLDSGTTFPSQEQYDGSWTLDFSAEQSLQMTPSDEYGQQGGGQDLHPSRNPRTTSAWSEEVSLSPNFSTTSCKRRASPTPLEGNCEVERGHPDLLSFEDM